MLRRLAAVEVRRLRFRVLRKPALQHERRLRELIAARYSLQSEPGRAVRPGSSECRPRASTSAATCEWLEAPSIRVMVIRHEHVHWIWSISQACLQDSAERESSCEPLGASWKAARREDELFWLPSFVEQRSV